MEAAIKGRRGQEQSESLQVKDKDLELAEIKKQP